MKNDDFNFVCSAYYSDRLFGTLRPLSTTLAHLFSDALVSDVFLGPFSGPVTTSHMTCYVRPCIAYTTYKRFVSMCSHNWIGKKLNFLSHTSARARRFGAPRDVQPTSASNFHNMTGKKVRAVTLFNKWRPRWRCQ